MSTTPSSPLAILAAEGKFDAVEEQWMAAVEAGNRDLDDFAKAAIRLVDAGQEDTAGALLACLLEQMADDEPTDEVLEFAEQAVRLAIGDRTLREQAAAIHTRAGRPELGALLALLDTKNGARARERVMGFLQLRAGKFVSGTKRVGPEQVVRFDANAGVFVLTDGQSERALTPADAVAELKVLPDDNFRAQIRFDLEALKQQAQTDPSRLVQAALEASDGRLEYGNLKKLLMRGVVPQNAFARWWNRAHGLVERNPMIQVYGDKEPILILRTEPISHEEELTARLPECASPLDRVRLVIEYLDSIEQGHEPQDGFLRGCAQLLAGIAADSRVANPVALLAAQVREEILARTAGEPEPPIDLHALLARPGGFGEAATLLAEEDLVRRALFFLREKSPTTWPGTFATALPNAPGRLTDMLARTLLAAGHGEELARAMQQILASPDRFGDGLFWLWKAATSGSLDEAPHRTDLVTISLALLRLMDRWARSGKTQVSEAQRSLLAKMRIAVGANKHRAIDRVLEEVDDTQAVVLYQTVLTNQGITDVSRYHISEALKARHRDAILGKKELWEDGFIYVSPQGLQARQGEYDQIVNVDMVKNSAAIGHAAGFGDLSENAEFTAALEQRDFLSRRANEIGEELQRARTIPIESIETDRVNVGTRIRVRGVGGGEEQTLTFLGPWDADPDHGIYSYLAPFSLAFLGRRVGEIVATAGENGEHQLEILTIERAEQAGI